MTDTRSAGPDTPGRAEPAREIREERKTVTAVFADVVGSTALAERLDPEEFRLIVGEAISRMVHAVESFGGTQYCPQISRVLNSSNRQQRAGLRFS